ncbi:MAG: ABC transporter substrate-binding protein [Chloroflexi bacterium]|nr:ABC transporter substrate-binding protein [Chloroflexota bacterium]
MTRAPMVGFLVALVAALALASACGDDGDEDSLERVVFMAGYRAQANLPFVAVYIADARGFFADEGLEVEIRHATQGEHGQLLLAGEIDFTTETAAQTLRQRANGLPVRAIALFGQRGDQGFVVHADSGIEGPEDFEGHSVGFKLGVVPAELLALLATAELGWDDVQLQAVGFDERVFIEGQVDVYPVFLNNEPNRIRNAGVDIRVFDPHDYGVATLGVAYTAHEETTVGRRDLVERFLRAALRGAEYAAARPDEAIDLVLTYAEGADRDHQRFLFDTDLRNAAREDGMGRATLDQWEALQEVLLRYDEQFSGRVDVASVFDPSFADALYDDSGRLR